MGIASAIAFLLAPALVLSVADGGAPASSRTPSLLAPVVGGRTAEPPPRYQLRATKGGGYEYDDARFKASIARDGRVSFVDHHGKLALTLVPFLPEPHPEGTTTLEGTVRGLLTKRRRPPPPPPARDPQATPAIATAEGAPPHERDRKYKAENPVIPATVLKGTMDLTDEYLRLMGEDPYRREKARFLAATFDMRLGMAVHAEAADAREALFKLPERLEAIWADRTQPAPARRQVLCGLWTELRREAGGGTAPDDKAGQAARVIESFVRTHLPAGSPHAYTAPELATCGDAKGVRFSPYSASAPEAAPSNVPATSAPSSK